MIQEDSTDHPQWLINKWSKRYVMSVYGVSITGYLLRLPTTAGSPRNSSHQKARVDEWISVSQYTWLA
jgi:hypothetical protein